MQVNQADGVVVYLQVVIEISQICFCDHGKSLLEKTTTTTEPARKENLTDSLQRNDKEIIFMLKMTCNIYQHVCYVITNKQKPRYVDDAVVDKRK